MTPVQLVEELTLASDLRSDGDIDQSAALLHKLIETIESLLAAEPELAQPSHPDYQDTQLALGMALGGLAECYGYQDDLSQAALYFDKESRLLAELYDQTRAPDALNAYIVALQNQGLMRQEFNDIAGARAYFEKALKYSEQADMMFSNQASLAALSLSQRLLADTCIEQGEGEPALDILLEARDTAQRILNGRTSIRHIVLWLGIVREIACLYRQFEAPEEAIAALDDALILLDQHEQDVVVDIDGLEEVIRVWLEYHACLRVTDASEQALLETYEHLEGLLTQAERFTHSRFKNLAAEFERDCV